MLADYADGGGRIVLASHAWWNYTYSGNLTFDIRGRFASGGYNPLQLGTSGVGGPTWTMVPVQPSHPLLANVNSLNVIGIDNTTSIAPGATLVAVARVGNNPPQYDHPLVAYKGNVVALNFFPASSQVQGGGWVVSTDGARLIANALLFTGAVTDTDTDGVADTTDNCPAVPNADQINTDGDALGDACDTDDDNDGVADINDAFPLNAAETVDTDHDGIGNNADTDDDGDGVLDVTDAFPLNAAESVDTDGDGVGNNADTDDDGDGVLDINDAFPLDADRISGYRP